MSELSKVFGNSGNGFAIECEKKTYRMKLVDQSVKVDFEKRLYECAKQSITSLRKDLTSEEYLTLLREVTTAYQEGEFSLEGKRGQKSIQGAKGSVILISLLLDCSEMEALSAVSEKPEEFTLAMESVIKESFPGTRKRIQEQRTLKEEPHDLERSPEKN